MREGKTMKYILSSRAMFVVIIYVERSAEMTFFMLIFLVL